MIDPVLPLSPFSPSEILERAVSNDEREWVPAAAPNVWMRPLLFDTIQGAWVNVVRMRTQGFTRNSRSARCGELVDLGAHHARTFVR